MALDMKLAELQIAFPKKYGAGNMQNVLHQHSQIVQSQLAEAAKKKKQDARTRKQVTEKRTSANIGRKRHGGNIHPYKGKTIDIKG
jgi:F0F1-type ATP synthase membrane subunit b/b'